MCVLVEEGEGVCVSGGGGKVCVLVEGGRCVC